MTELEQKCNNFLIENKVSFEQMIRCFNFWTALHYGEKCQLLEDYEDGAFRYGWY